MMSLYLSSINDELVSFDDYFHHSTSAASVSYSLSNHALTPGLSSLDNGGANGGAAGNDARTLSWNLCSTMLMSSVLGRVSSTTFHPHPLLG